MLSERIKEVKTYHKRRHYAQGSIWLMFTKTKKNHIHEVAISALCATADTILSKICAECRYTVPK